MIRCRPRSSGTDLGAGCGGGGATGSGSMPVTPILGRLQAAAASSRKKLIACLLQEPPPGAHPVLCLRATQGPGWTMAAPLSSAVGLRGAGLPEPSGIPAARKAVQPHVLLLDVLVAGLAGKRRGGKKVRHHARCRRLLGPEHHVPSSAPSHSLQGSGASLCVTLRERSLDHARGPEAPGLG